MTRTYAILGASVVLAACSAESVPAERGRAGASAGSGGAGGASIGIGGQGADLHCSNDLQSVLDAEGNVVVACPPDQGCAGGACIPACEAAAKSLGSIGYEFWAPDPPFSKNGEPNTTYAGPCYAVFLANTWDRPVQISVARGGQTFDVNAFGRIPKGLGAATQYQPIPATGVPPDEVAVLFLSHKTGASFGCPIPPALSDDAAVSGSGTGAAFQVTTDTPVTLYDMLPYGGAKSFLPSASLLSPATAWGKSYIAVSPHLDGPGQPWVLVVGAANDTEVTVSPKVTLPGGAGLADALQGQANDYTLHAGQTLQWIGADPAGSVFTSDKPIAVFTGHTLLKVATATSPNGGGEDSAHQQVPYVNALGHEYVGAGIVTRRASLEPESVPYRLMGVVSGTQLVWDPSAPEGAPTQLAAGQVAEFETMEPFSVRAQDPEHPFIVTQYMPGQVEGRPGCSPEYASQCALGDEDWTILVSPRQFLDRYVFFTDPTYATTNLVITRTQGKAGFADVTVDCIGTVAGWQPVGSDGTFEVAHVDLVRAGLPSGSCATSRHEAASSAPFGVSVWGTDFYASYGYPAGGSLAAINDVVIEPPK